MGEFDIAIPDGYAIYNKATKKWSRGGSGPNWGKTPKIWSDIGHLKHHLRLFVDHDYGYRYQPKRPEVIVIRNVYNNSVIVDMGTRDEFKDFTIREYLLGIAQEEAKYKRVDPLLIEWRDY